MDVKSVGISPINSSYLAYMRKHGPFLVRGSICADVANNDSIFNQASASLLEKMREALYVLNLASCHLFRCPKGRVLRTMTPSQTSSRMTTKL